MGFFEKLQQETGDCRSTLYSVPFIVNAIQGDITKDAYLAFLQEAYHHVKNTLPLLMLMGSRLPKKNEWVRRALVEYIEEETGHDDWILGDIEKAGGNVEMVKNSQPSLPVELMNAFNYDIISRINPMGYFGMIFVLEGTSVANATKAAEALQKSLGLNKECFSYLMSHGDLDIEHTQYIAKLLDKVTDEKDQADIIHASRVIYHLYAEMFRSIPLSSKEQVAA